MDEAMLKSGQYPNIAIEAGTDPAEVMREHGRAEVDSREKLETDILFEYLESPGDQNRIFAYLDRQAAITERECCEKWPGRANVAELERRLKRAEEQRDHESAGCRAYAHRIAELEAERDQLSRDLDAEHALVVQFEYDNERLRDANNTLRASVAGLKMTVDKLKASDGQKRADMGN